MRIQITPIVREIHDDIDPNLLKKISRLKKENVFKNSLDKAYAITMTYCTTLHMGCMNVDGISALTSLKNSQDQKEIVVEHLSQFAFTQFCSKKGLSLLSDITVLTTHLNIDSTGELDHAIEYVCGIANDYLKKYQIKANTHHECISTITPYGIILYSEFIKVIANEMKKDKTADLSALSQLVHIIPFDSSPSTAHTHLKDIKNFNEIIGLIFKQTIFKDTFDVQFFTY
jgi:hypothetical protein